MNEQAQVATTWTSGVITAEVWAAYLAHFDVYDRAYIRLQQGIGETRPAREVLDL